MSNLKKPSVLCASAALLMAGVLSNGAFAQDNTAVIRGVAPLTKGAPKLKAAPDSEHRGANIQVSGSGFAHSEAVDIYFDSVDVALLVSTAKGKFNDQSFPVPSNAVSGVHWITAIGRTTGDAAQQIFTVESDWTQGGFDAGRKGRNPYENVLSQGNVGQLDIAWTATAGDDGIYSSPTVANGIVYVGSDGNNFYAFNAETGAPIWMATTGDSIDNSPAVANGIVYVGSNDDKLYAFNAATGATVWTATTGGAIAISSPVVANGLVYVCSEDGKLYAFRAATGATVWTGAGINSGSSPAVANGVVYVGDGGGTLHAFDAATGATLWANDVGEYSFPTVANGVVYDSTGDGHLYAFNAATGTSLPGWPLIALGSAMNASPTVANGIVYVGDLNSNVLAFDARTGASLWTATLHGSVTASVAVANGVVYIGSEDDNLYAFNMTTGALLWTSTTGGEIYSSAAVANGMVYVGSYDDKTLHAYALNGGNNATYKRSFLPPSLSTLHPNRNLLPTKF